MTVHDALGLYAWQERPESFLLFYLIMQQQQRQEWPASCLKMTTSHWHAEPGCLKPTGLAVWNNNLMSACGAASSNLVF